jgi:hypothetical protein
MKVTVIFNGVPADQNSFKAAVMAAIEESWDLPQINAAVNRFWSNNEDGIPASLCAGTL